ncbi:MAG: hypothetical protein CM1200mP13_17110 [Candidatus Pelagibacterales bacterium]|nr:MAG: hypothetical protein CM1200mP13_17110 [Pelagibacterales bacterium]
MLIYLQILDLELQDQCLLEELVYPKDTTTSQYVQNPIIYGAKLSGKFK